MRLRVSASDDAELSADETADLVVELNRWSDALAGIARTGMGFTENLYERERYAEVLHIAADIRVTANIVLHIDDHRDRFVDEWIGSIGAGVPGYVTPKVAVGAVVGDDEGRILLVQRADSGIWLYPTGWADIGYSPAEVAVKEVAEETGIDCEPVQLMSVIDGHRNGFARFGMYMLLFHCRATGGELRPHPLETSDVGWFRRDELPERTAGASWWAKPAFDAIDGVVTPTTFDPVRDPIWKAGDTPG